MAGKTEKKKGGLIFSQHVQTHECHCFTSKNFFKKEQLHKYLLTTCGVTLTNMMQVSFMIWDSVEDIHSIALHIPKGNQIRSTREHTVKCNKRPWLETDRDYFCGRKQKMLVSTVVRDMWYNIPAKTSLCKLTDVPQESFLYSPFIFDLCSSNQVGEQLCFSYVYSK